MAYLATMPRPADLTDPRLCRILTMLGDLRASRIEVDVPDSRFLIGFCWYNAYAQARKNGDIVHGWLFWDDNAGVLAQHHSVWRRPDGRLIDVTPNEFGASHTVFAESVEHRFDYARLKTWISLRCRSPKAVSFEHIGPKGDVWGNGTAPKMARLKPFPEELIKIRKLCPEAGGDVSS
jgi:hypothetical protein